MRWEHIQGKTDCVFTRGEAMALYHIREGEVLLFDSGDEPCPELLDELERRGLRVRAVLCTHLHPDHVANNGILVERYGAEILAGQEDIRIVSSDTLYCEEYGLVDDVAAARAERARQYSYPMTPIPEGATSVMVDEVRIGVLPTPGHSRGHLALITPDGVCCVGDALISSRILKVSKMPYMLDVNQAILSMEVLRESRYPFYVVSHREVVPQAELSRLVDDNIEKELQIYGLLLHQIDGAVSVDELAKRLLRSADVINPSSMRADVLLQTARARVMGLVDAGELCYENGMVSHR